MRCEFRKQYEWLGLCDDCPVTALLSSGDEGVAAALDVVSPSIEICCRTVPQGKCPVAVMVVSSLAESNDLAGRCRKLQARSTIG